MFATDIRGIWGLLCLLQIFEVVEACCACNRYWRWSRCAVLCWLRLAVLATDIGGG